MGKHLSACRRVLALFPLVFIDPVTGFAQAAREPSEFQAVVISQSADGLSEAQMDMNFLKAMEAWTIERMNVNTSKALKANGLADATVPAITAESAYLYAGGKKLMLIRTKTQAPKGQGVGSVIVGALFGDEFRRVSCVAKTDDSIPITFGPCADKIEEAFGFRIGATK